MSNARVILDFIDTGIEQFLPTHHLLPIYKRSLYKSRGLKNFNFSAFPSFNSYSNGGKRKKKNKNKRT